MPRGIKPGSQISAGLKKYKELQKEASDLRKKDLIEKSSMLNMNSAFLDIYLNKGKARDKGIAKLQAAFKGKKQKIIFNQKLQEFKAANKTNKKMYKISIHVLFLVTIIHTTGTINEACHVL